MRCEVLKPFQPFDHLVQPGEQVDTAGWREPNLRNLLERRYLLPVDAAPAVRRMPPQGRK